MLPKRSGFLEKAAAAGLVLGLCLGVLVTTLVFTLLAARSSGDEEGVRVLRLAHGLDQTHPVHLAMEFMAEDLAERSGGTIRIQVYPSEQLGSETDCIAQVQRGTLDMTKTSTAAMEGFIPEMALFGLPYLFEDADHYWEVLNSEIGEELLTKGDDKGMHGLCYYDSGSRSFYTTDKPILTPDDLQGQKIRVIQSRMAMDMISQLGGSPTPIPWGDLYTALQQGMVDGAENNPPSIYTNRHHEVARYFSLDEHTRVPDMVLFSTKVWNSFTPQERAWIKASAEASVEYQRGIWKEQSAAALAAMEADGVEIHYPDKAPFREKVRPMYEQFVGTEIGNYVERIRAMAE
jgi:tripartite ATP-independent transporter DctP family solute receptor